MDESRKRAASTVNDKAMNSSLDVDFGKDFLSSWKSPNSGKDTIDFNVESVPKGSKKFIVDTLDDLGLDDGVFGKLSSFKMDMSGLDFSSPVKKKVKHASSNGDDLSKGTLNDFLSFDIELGKFNIDARLGIDEKSLSTVTGKTNPVSSEGNKDIQRDLPVKGTYICGDSKSKEQTQTQTQGTSTLGPSHLTRQEGGKNGSCRILKANATDSSDVMQEITSVSPSRMEQTHIGPTSNDRHGEHSKETYASKSPDNKYFQNVSCSAVPVQDPTQVSADPVISKEGPKVDFCKVHVSTVGNDDVQSVSSQSRNISTVNPCISRSVGQSGSQNEVEENVSPNEASQDNQSICSNPKLSTRRSYGTKNGEEGTSVPKRLSSSVQRENRDIEPSQVNETGTFSLLPKSANIKSNRIELTSENLKKSAGGSKVMSKMATHPTDLKREHKLSNAGTDKSKTALSKTYMKPALHGLLTTSMNINDAKNGKLSFEPPSAQKLSKPNTRSSTVPATEHKIVSNHVLLKSSDDSDSMQSTPSKHDKTRAISQLGGRRITRLGISSPKSGIFLEKESVEASGGKDSLVTTSKILNPIAKGKSTLLRTSIMQKESVLDPKAPKVLKHTMRSPTVRKSPQTVPELENQTIVGCGTPKARMENEISSSLAYEMGDISDLELPALLENDGHVEKAEACRKDLEDMCILLKKKHAEAKELEVRAIVNNNEMLMLYHPMFELEEKIRSLQKFANSLRSKKYSFEEVSNTDSG